MIFVTVGSQKFQFNRLLKKVDELIADMTIKEEVFAQIGYSDYRPTNYRYKEFLDSDEFVDTMGKCDILITHGGTGAIICGVKKGKKVIAVPRLVKYSEHVDDHQLQLLKQFDELKIIYPCYDSDELDSSLKMINEIELNQYESNTKNIIENIEAFLDD
ncbi:MAG: PssE/Cps14G family polysaccharide biosynthesis glycosyltransferase [Aminipila sp.]